MKKFQLQTFETGMQARSFSLRNLAKLQRAQIFLNILFINFLTLKGKFFHCTKVLFTFLKDRIS